jgi:cell division topological specificity factor
MDNFIDRLLGKKQQSAAMAKDRLKLVLIHDRTDITPGLLDRMKNEIIEVISRFVEIDPEFVKIEMSQEGREQRLIADIPLNAVPHKRKK